MGYVHLSRGNIHVEDIFATRNTRQCICTMGICNVCTRTVSRRNDHDYSGPIRYRLLLCRQCRANGDRGDVYGTSFIADRLHWLSYMDMRQSDPWCVDSDNRCHMCSPSECHLRCYDRPFDCRRWSDILRIAHHEQYRWHHVDSGDELSPRFSIPARQYHLGN